MPCCKPSIPRVSLLSCPTRGHVSYHPDCRTLDCRTLDCRTLDGGLSTMDFRLWTFDSGLWTLDYFAPQSHGGQPLSKTIFHVPSGCRCQTELNVPMRLPFGSSTGPLVNPRLPDDKTSTSAGDHENGAAGPSKNPFHSAETADFPRVTAFPPQE